MMYYVDIYSLGLQVGPFATQHEASDWTEKEFKEIVIVGEQLVWKLRSPEKNCFFKSVLREHIGNTKEDGFWIEFSQKLWGNITARAKPWEVVFE